MQAHFPQLSICCIIAVSTSLWFRPIALVAFAILILARGISLAQTPASTGPDPAKIYSDAMGAFQSGDYATAASKLEEVIRMAGKDAQLESVYFSLGAAYYNLEQYPKAIEWLKTYEKKYPNGARIADATFSIAQASMQTKKYAEAAAQFAKLENVPALRERALFFGAMAAKEAGKLDEAIRMLEKLVAGEINSETSIKGAMLLAGYYGEKKLPDKANALVAKILEKTALVDNIAQLNHMATELGDQHLQGRRPHEALAAYRLVRSKDEVIKFQAERFATLQRRFEKNLATMRANPAEGQLLIAENNNLRDEIAEARKLYEQARELPDYTPAMLIRIGRAFYDQGKRWESLVAYTDLLAKYPEAKEKETAMFAAVVAYAEVNRLESARRLGENFFREFPKSSNAHIVGYLLGASALQSNDPVAAATYFGRALEQHPKSDFSDEMRFLLGNAKFAQGKFEDAIREYERYQKEFASGSHAEEVAYRIAVGLVFAGKYEQAMGKLEGYLQKYPKGDFAADAKYRLALCYYAAQQYDEVIKRCRDWEKEFGQHAQLGEVLALLGDCLNAKGETDAAVRTYIRSYKAASTDEVLNYSLFEAQKGLQKKGDWAQMSAMFEEFVKNHPDHSATVMAVYWIGKARAREGKVDEAKQFIASTVKKHIGDRNRDAVEQLLSQLAQLCARRKAAPTPAPAASPFPAGPGSAASSTEVAAASPSPSPLPTPSPSPSPAVDPGAELEALLGGGEPNPTTKARILYAKSELARLRRKPDEQEKHLKAIADNFKPEDLSVMLVAQAGDLLLSKGEMGKAETFFRYLMKEHPKSELVDFAYNGLGEIAYQKRDYPTALKYFSDAIDNVGANMKLKDVTVGRAKTLLAMNKLDEAQKEFEQVATVREWRGEATARAVYSLGEIDFKRGKYAEANAAFQRVFVAYQKFLPWVAKAYIMSGECFEKLGKTPEAIRTYQEMLRNEKLSKFEEARAAQQRLQQLGEGAQG